MSRDGHVQAVGFAGLQIEELENMLLAVKEKQQECLGLVATAVGEQPVVESARNALEFTAALDDRLGELVGMCESIKAELNRYGGGF
jgi:hypothetical protein